MEKEKVPLADARKTAAILLRQLRKFCVRCKVAGSIRRKKPEVSDIEIVYVPRVERKEISDQLFPHSQIVNLMDEEISKLVAAGRLVAAGGFVLQLEDSKSSAPRPVRENQVRPLLNKLPTKHQVPCWEGITEKTAPTELTGEIIEAEVIQYRKRIPKRELQASKPARKAKKKRIAPEEKAREKSHALVDKLKAFADQLPQSDSILKALKELKALIDRKK